MLCKSLEVNTFTWTERKSWEIMEFFIHIKQPRICLLKKNDKNIVAAFLFDILIKHLIFQAFSTAGKIGGIIVTFRHSQKKILL